MSIAPISNGSYSADFSTGRRINLSRRDNELILNIVRTVGETNVYVDSGYWESDIIDLSQFAVNLKSISNSSVVENGTVLTISTSTSNDMINFTEYETLGDEGSIVSPFGRYIKVRVDFLAAIDPQVNIINDFDSSESVEFQSDEFLQFDGSLKLKNSFNYEFKEVGTVDHIYSITNFNKDDFYKIDLFHFDYVEVDEFTKLPDPSVLPPNTGVGASFSSDGSYLAVVHGVSPYVTIYKRDGDVFTKLPNPSVLPPNTGVGASFSSDGSYLAVVHNNSPYVTIYKRDGDIFTKLRNPSILPTGIPYDASFTSDGSYLAVVFSSSPFIAIYKRDGDVFTKLPNPSVLPVGTSRGVSFTSDGSYLAVVCSGSPYVTIYKRDGDVFTKLPDPSVLPTSTPYDASFTSDGSYLAVVCSGSPYVTIYKRDGDVFTKLPDPSVLPTGSGNGSSFSSDGSYLAVVHNNSPYVTIYELHPPIVNKMLISSDGEYLKYNTENHQWEIVSSTLPDAETFMEEGMSDISVLDSKNDYSYLLDMNNDGVLGEGIVFRGLINLNNFLDTKTIGVRSGTNERQ